MKTVISLQMGRAAVSPPPLPLRLAPCLPSSAPLGLEAQSRPPAPPSSRQMGTPWESAAAGSLSGPCKGSTLLTRLCFLLALFGRPSFAGPWSGVHLVCLSFAASVCYSACKLPLLASAFWRCQAMQLHAWVSKEMQINDTPGGSCQHSSQAGGHAWEPQFTNGLLWDLSLYFAASPITPKNAKPPAR